MDDTHPNTNTTKNLVLINTSQTATEKAANTCTVNQQQPKTKKNTYVEAATSPNTRKAYQQDIRHFVGAGGLLPTTTEAIIQYLTHFATTLNPRTLSRRLTALKLWPTHQGFYDPTQPPCRQTNPHRHF